MNTALTNISLLLRLVKLAGIPSFERRCRRKWWRLVSNDDRICTSTYWMSPGWKRRGRRRRRRERILAAPRGASGEQTRRGQARISENRRDFVAQRSDGPGRGLVSLSLLSKVSYIIRGNDGGSGGFCFSREWCGRREERSGGVT